MKKVPIYLTVIVLVVWFTTLSPQSYADSPGKSATPVKQLSCSKQARRIAKIKDKMKRRVFIKQCRKKREAKEKAEALAKEKEKKRKKAETQ